MARVRWEKPGVPAQDPSCRRALRTGVEAASRTRIEGGYFTVAASPSQQANGLSVGALAGHGTWIHVEPPDVLAAAADGHDHAFAGTEAHTPGRQVGNADDQSPPQRAWRT